MQQEGEQGTDGQKVGICCSGGGIRAASFALGALQVLQEKGQLHGPSKAKHLSAVSGGSYIVGAMASVQKSIEDGSSPAPDPMPAFAPGSPEELRLRTRLGYLTRGPGGVPLAMWRLFLGIAVNLLLLGAIVLVAGVVAGWAYGWALPQLRWYAGNATAPHAAGTHIVPPMWTLLVLVALVAMAFVVGLASVFAVRPRQRRTRIRMAVISWVALVAAVAWAVFVLGMPQLLAWLHRITVAADDANEAGQHLPVFSLAGIAGVFAAVAGLVAPLVRWVRAGLVETQKPESWVGKLLRRIRKPLLSLLMLISIPLFLVGAFVWFARQAAADPPIPGAHSGAGAVWLWAGLAGASIAFLLVAQRIGDLNKWSLHAIYEERLADAFGVERCRPEDPGSTVVGEEAARTRTEPLQLSKSQAADFPEVLVCATANVFEYGVAPTARGAAPFLFSAAFVGDDDQISGAAKTDRYEQWGFDKPEDLSLTTAISISGAAVAPQMGKETRRPFRFLLALANIRLGVWLPKPKRLANFGLGGRTPGPSYLLLHEMLGVGSDKDPFVYVTDGGHYDNLGLVELFRRQCDWIWCIDASGDEIDTFSTLGNALAMAEADLGVTVDIHPGRDMAPASGSRFVRQPFCVGTVTYPDPTQTKAEKTGTLVVVKAGVPENAPWSVRSYHAENEAFPCDPTLDQLYTASRCDAYVQLGRFAMSEAWGAHQPPAARPRRSASSRVADGPGKTSTSRRLRRSRTS